MIAGLALLAVGALFWVLEGRGIVPGRLPGDIVFRRGNFTFAFPIVTCIVLSIVLTLLFRLFNR
jgi:hypothetical protein